MNGKLQDSQGERLQHGVAIQDTGIGTISLKKMTEMVKKVPARR